MSPTAHLPTVPTLLLILQWITAWYTDTAIVLYQLTGTQTCQHTSLSRPLAQFTASLSLATDYGFYFAACIMHDAFTIAIIIAALASVPRVYPALPGNRVPAQAGAEKLAGGSGESHLTRKQTRSRHLPVLLLLLPLHTHMQNCRQENTWPLLRLARTASTEKNGLKNANCLRWTNWRHLYPLLATVLACLTRWLVVIRLALWLRTLPLVLVSSFSVMEVLLSRLPPTALLILFLAWVLGVACHFLWCLLCMSPAMPLQIWLSKMEVFIFHFLRCHALLHMSNLHGSSLLHRFFYHHLTITGCYLKLANLIAKNWSWNLPFLASKSDIRCYTWFYSCFASGLSPLDRGFTTFATTWVWITEVPFLHSSFGVGSPLLWPSTVFTVHCAWRTGFLCAISLSLFTCHVVDLPSELL